MAMVWMLTGSNRQDEGERWGLYMLKEGILVALMVVESHPRHCSSSWRARMALASRWLVRAVVEFF